MTKIQLTQNELINQINETDENVNATIVYIDLFDKSIGLPPGEYSYFEINNQYGIIRDTDILTYKKMLEIINKYASQGLKGNKFIPYAMFDNDNDIEYDIKEEIL